MNELCKGQVCRSDYAFKGWDRGLFTPWFVVGVDEILGGETIQNCIIVLKL